MKPNLDRLTMCRRRSGWCLVPLDQSDPFHLPQILQRGTIPRRIVDDNHLVGNSRCEFADAPEAQLGKLGCLIMRNNDGNQRFGHRQILRGLQNRNPGAGFR